MESRDRCSEEGDAPLVARILEESIGNERNGYHEVTYHPYTRRAISLTMGTQLSAPFDHHWDLSPTIALLDDLESLELTSCKTIPPELRNLKRMKSLTLIGCKRLEEFPENLFQSKLCEGTGELIGLTQLQELRILGIIPIIPSYIISHIAPLKDLRVLQFSFHSLSLEEECLNLQQYCRPEIQFNHSLRQLILNRCHITNRGFEALFDMVIHQYPNLQKLYLCKNQITSLRCLASEEALRRARYSQLEELALSDNPVWSSPQNADDEQRYLGLFLERCAVRLWYFGYRFYNSRIFSPTNQHWLDVNKSGRFLIDQGFGDEIGWPKCESKSCSTTMLATARKPSITPLSLWPFILAKVYDPRNHNTMDSSHPDLRRANILYFLIRNGPVLAGRKF
ncbi:hypothetical protein IV203_028758 [Nitzschia inconspicua]|uniref:Uncharacterized protein n=1 Tax=Nitzschia inconspicua TaxID=303405 RepID=A0A9K3Q021_9STRA|nr:hypothetical protein IV203_028758 [Nitzschia inconspicua]